MQDFNINIHGMNCSHCVKTIEAQLLLIDGVKANVSLEKENAEISAPPNITRDSLVEAIKVAGFAAK